MTLMDKFTHYKTLKNCNMYYSKYFIGDMDTFQSHNETTISIDFTVEVLKKRVSYVRHRPISL